MRVGISDKYLDKYYLPLVDNFDYIEYQIYEQDKIAKLEHLEKKCFVHLNNPASVNFLDLILTTN